MPIIRFAIVTLMALPCCMNPHLACAQSVFIASGTNTAGIQSTVEAFRMAIGNPNNGNSVGSQGFGNRQLTWDGGDNDAAPSLLLRDFFNAIAPRGAIFSGPFGSTFMSSADSTNAYGIPIEFGQINATYPTAFATLSAPRLFAPLNHTVMDVEFFIPGTLEPAGSRGFAAVFTDVDLSETSQMEFFDIGGTPLYQGYFPPKPPGADDESLSFLGVVLPATSPLVSRVRLTFGESPMGLNDVSQGGEFDIVVADDFIYGEPVPLPALNILDASVTEGDSGETLVEFSLVLSATSPFDVTVEYEIHAAGASFLEDFTPVSGTLTFPSPATAATVAVPVLGDTLREPDEKFDLIATRHSSSLYVPDCRGTVTILDDDAPSGNSLSGFVFEDIVFDGIKSATEPGVAGVPIVVTGIANLSDPLHRQTRTDSDGYYSFEDLPPGVYNLTKTPPPGLIEIAATPGVPFGGASVGSNQIESIVIPVGAAAGVNYNFSHLAGIQTIREVVGPSPASIQATVDSFRADLGGANNGTIPGSQGTGRREINWDGVPDGNSAPSRFPGDFFNTVSPRGADFSSPTGRIQFQVSADSDNPTLTLAEFGNISPTYPMAFQTFSAQRLFLSANENVYDLTFRVPGSTQPATVRGIGIVFTDVDTAGSSKIELFDAFGDLLIARNILASTGDASLSFLGISVPSNGKQICLVRITVGNGEPGMSDLSQGGMVDIAALDDFLYAEPVPLVPSAQKGAHLAVDLDQDGEADVGDTIRYRIRVANPLGLKLPDLDAVEFFDFLPSGLSLSGLRVARGGNGLEDFGNSATWNGTIPPQDSLAIDIDAKVDLSSGGKTLNNQGVFSFNEDGDSTGETAIRTDDPDTGAESDPTVRTIQPFTAPNLNIEKSLNQPVAIPGSQAIYSVTVTNTGAAATLGAQVLDLLPAEVSNAVWTCQVTGGAGCTPESGSGDVSAQVDVPVGGSVVFTVTATISATALGTLANTVSLPSGETDPDPSDNSATVSVDLSPMADLEIDKMASVDTTGLGETVLYTATIRNNGPSRATGVRVTDVGPPGASLISSSLGCALDGPGVTCDLGDLSAGQTASVTLEVGLYQAGLVENIMQVEGNEPDGMPFNNVSQAAVFVVEAASPTPSPTATQLPVPSFHPADINEDNRVDPKDLLELLGAWKIDLTVP